MKNSQQDLSIDALMVKNMKILKQEVTKLMGNKVHYSEYSVLSMLSKDGIKTNELSKKLDISASQITAITDGLIRKNLIHREPSETDRRVILIALTNQGEELLKEIVKKKEQLLNDLFASFTEEEKDALHSMHQKLLDQLLLKRNL